MIDKVATNSYHQLIMEILKTVGIKDLKNNLSAYIQEIKRGGVRILVTDRDIVVAELTQPLSTHPISEENPLLAQWIREGKVRPATRPRQPCARTKVKLSEGTAQRLIDEDRNEDKFDNLLLP